MVFNDGVLGRDLRPSPRAVRRAAEVVLVVALAAQCARLLWAVATPLDPVGEPAAAAPPRPFTPPPDLSALERFAPMTPAAPTLAVEAVPAAPPISGYRLLGVRASIGDGGSAIIAGPDGRQESYRPGRTVGPGVTLAAIGRDAVTLTGAGGSVRLELGEPSGGSAPPPPFAPLALPAQGPGLVPPTPPVATPAPTGTPAQLMSQLNLSPRQDGGRVSGYQVGARAAPLLLRQAGLRPGDVLLSVNGQALNPGQVDEIGANLAGVPEAEVRFQRNGQTLTTRIRTGAR